MKFHWDYRASNANDDLLAFYQTFVGHELANQLVAAQGLARVALSDLVESAESDVRPYLTRLADLIRSTDEQARQVAQLGRLLREPARGATIILGDIVCEALLRVSAMFPRDDIEYVTHIDPIQTDVSPRLLLRVVMELLSNAIHAIPLGEKGTIRIEASTLHTGWELTITDSGCGLSENDLAKIRMPFPPTHASRDTGHGLGLFLIRQAVHRWQGQLWLDSQPGHTTFRLEIPPSEVS